MVTGELWKESLTASLEALGQRNLPVRERKRRMHREVNATCRQICHVGDAILVYFKRGRQKLITHAHVSMHHLFFDFLVELLPENKPETGFPLQSYKNHNVKN